MSGRQDDFGTPDPRGDAEGGARGAPAGDSGSWDGAPPARPGSGGDGASPHDAWAEGPAAAAGAGGSGSGGNDWDDGGRHGNGPGRGNLPAHRRGALDPVGERRPAYPPDAPGAHHHGDPDEITIDLRRYIGLAIKHRWLIVGVAVTTVVVGLLWTLLQTPIYRGEATIEIKRETINVSGLADLETAESGGAEFYETQYQILRSRSLAAGVAARLNLAEDEAFLNEGASMLSNLSGLFMGVGRARERPDLAERERQATRRLMDNMSIEPVRSSSVVRITYESADPRIAERVANAYAETFIEQNLDRRFGATSYARSYLQERLDELRVNLEESEAELVAYAEKTGIVTDEGERTLAQERLAEANRALGEAENEVARTRTQWQQARDSEVLPSSMRTGAVETLRDRRAELEAEYQDKLSLFKPGYPEMVNLRTRIEEIDRQIDLEVGLVRQGVRLAHEAAVAEKQALEEEVAKLSRDVMEFRNQNIRYNILRREVDTNRSLYEGLLERYKEIGVAGGIDQSNAANNVAVIDRAETPRSPYKPRLGLNLALSLMLGLMFGGAAAVGREFLDDTFKTPEDVEEVLGLPLLGVIPKTPQVEDLAGTLDDPRSPVGEAYRSLRTALQFSTATGAPPSLLVTSTQPGEGKTTTALSVARNFARLGMAVLVVDADLRKPSLHRLLGCDGSAGLSNVLTGNMAPPEALRRTDLENLTALCSGPLPPNPAELLASSRMASFLSVARDKYDLVVVDGPPVGGLADAPILGSLAAGTLVVVEAHATLRKRVINALKRLHFARAELLGIAFNKFDVEQAGYGYGYGYGYGEDYYGYGAEGYLDEAEATAERIADDRER